ncbi:hypothetical protein MXB_1390 [Myxobolus squamalis]|nr:hypothetical protein MXB_1390 [Myxobolus squamalis]
MCYSGGTFQGLTLDKLVKGLMKENIKLVQKYTVIKSRNMQDCVASCCDSENCDIAFLNGSSCYNLGCKDVHDCVVKFDKNEQPLSSVTYMVRSKKDAVQLDFATQCQDYSHFILQNMSFVSIPISTLRFLGLVKTLDECARKCCMRYYCDTVYIIGYSCYGLICGENLNLCGYNNSFESSVPSFIVYNLKMEDKRRKLNFIIEYSIILLLILISSGIGLTITVKMCIRRHSSIFLFHRSRAKNLYRSYRDSDD